MIDIPALNSALIEENDDLEVAFATLAERDVDESSRVLLDALTTGLTAIHKRQGDLIILMLRTNR
jgi:hypothetical protein